VQRLGGQLRLAPSGTIIGWDMSAALSLAAALGVDPPIAAELLPVIEAAAMRGLNQTLVSAVENDHG